MEEFRKEKNESIIEGRNVVIEAFRSGQSIDRLYILDGCQDGPIMTIKREARKHDVVIKRLKYMYQRNVWIRFQKQGGIRAL